MNKDNPMTRDDNGCWMIGSTYRLCLLHSYLISVHMPFQDSRESDNQLELATFVIGTNKLNIFSQGSALWFLDIVQILSHPLNQNLFGYSLVRITELMRRIGNDQTA